MFHFLCKFSGVIPKLHAFTDCKFRIMGNQRKWDIRKSFHILKHLYLLFIMGQNILLICSIQVGYVGVAV